MAILLFGDFHNNFNKIIAAYAGTGNTTLAIKHPDLFVDFIATIVGNAGNIGKTLCQKIVIISLCSTS